MDFARYRAETERMVLRPYRLDDFDAFHDLHGRDDVARYLPGRPATRRRPARRWSGTRRPRWTRTTTA